VHSTTVTQPARPSKRQPNVFIVRLPSGNRCCVAFRGPHEGDATFVDRPPTIQDLRAIAGIISPAITIELGKRGSARRVLAAVLRETIGRQA
jgi:hypothetical protein